MGAGIIAEKIPIKMARNRNEELKLKNNARMASAMPPVPINHS